MQTGRGALAREVTGIEMAKHNSGGLNLEPAALLLHDIPLLAGPDPAAETRGPSPAGCAPTAAA